MPKNKQHQGEIKTGTEIGYKTRKKYIWCTCEGCGKERWVQIVKGKPKNLRCRPCAAEKGMDHSNWKGGKYISSDGYVQIWLPPNDFFYPMAMCTNHVFEHRLVMAKSLNRCLLPWEVVHHKGAHYPLGSVENKQDNSLENLELLPARKYHLVDTVIRGLIVNLQKRVTLLEAENCLLREKQIA